MQYYADDYLKSNENITESLNKLIQICEKGSKIIFRSNNIYTLGMIKLKYIELYFEEGCKIIVSSNINDFNYISKEDLIINDKKVYELRL